MLLPYLLYIGKTLNIPLLIFRKVKKYFSRMQRSSIHPPPEGRGFLEDITVNMTHQEELKWAEENCKYEMEQLGIDNLPSTNVCEGVYQAISYSEQKTIILALKLQKQINEMQKTIKDMKYNIRNHQHVF